MDENTGLAPILGLGKRITSKTREARCTKNGISWARAKENFDLASSKKRSAVLLESQKGLPLKFWLLKIPPSTRD